MTREGRHVNFVWSPYVHAFMNLRKMKIISYIGYIYILCLSLFHISRAIFCRTILRAQGAVDRSQTNSQLIQTGRRHCKGCGTMLVRLSHGSHDVRSCANFCGCRTFCSILVGILAAALLSLPGDYRITDEALLAETT